MQTREWAFFGGTDEVGSTSKFGPKGQASSRIFPGGRLASAAFFNRETRAFVVFGGTYGNEPPRKIEECANLYFRK